MAHERITETEELEHALFFSAGEEEVEETSALVAASSEGSLGAKIPWPDDKHFPNLDAEEALDLFLSWADEQGIEPWDHQIEALLSIAAGNHVVLGTPTGSGKSLVALGMCFISVCTDRRAVWTAPIKALVSEKFFDMVHLFGRENVGMITGDVVLNPEAPIVCCTAEILAQDTLRFGERADIGCVAMDEFHYYSDRDRGWAWQVPLLELPQAQFMLMSATLGDVSSIVAGLEERTGRSCDLVLDAPRPVPLTFEFVETALEATVELAWRKGDAPIYIVHFSQSAAIKSAQALSSYGVSSKEQREQIKEMLKGARFNTTFGKTLKRLLLTGVGVHHAGMLPRYRRLVEKLAQQGLLPVICGTDTLGVGINVPIHTVLLTALTKYDGHRQRRLNAREFHQIAGRAGRAGFDAEGRVICEATEYDIERARALKKAGGDPKKARKAHLKTPPKDFVSWSKQTFDRLVASAPEPLRARMVVKNSMILAMIARGGDALSDMHALIGRSGQTDEEKLALNAQVDEMFATLLDAGLVEKNEDSEGNIFYTTTLETPDNLALNQPLAPFMIAALELLDPESDTYALDVLSMVEAILENPSALLVAQEHECRSQALAALKMEGIDYEERMERIQEVSYPKPLKDLLDEAFERYCAEVPWAADYHLYPKSVLRDMVETASDFKTYIVRYNMARSEGTLLRYLSDAWNVLAHTVPPNKLDNRLHEIMSWLSIMLRSTDSSLLDEWAESDTTELDVQAPGGKDVMVADPHGVELLVRNALFARVRLAAAQNAAALGTLDADWGWREPIWQRALDSYFEAHEEILLTADARSSSYFALDKHDEQSKHLWSCHQIFLDEDSDGDFGIWATVDLDATQEEGSPHFASYHVGFYEDIAGKLSLVSAEKEPPPGDVVRLAELFYLARKSL